MKSIWKTLKYLVVYGLLLVAPAVVVAIVLIVIDKLNGGTMNSDTVWESPCMVPAIAVGTLLNIMVFLWRRWAVFELGRISRSDVGMVIVMAIVVFIGWFFPEDLLQRLIEVPSNLSEKDFDQMTGGVVGFIDTAFLTPPARAISPSTFAAFAARTRSSWLRRHQVLGLPPLSLGLPHGCHRHYQANHHEIKRNALTYSAIIS